MLAKNNECFEEAAATVYQLSQEERIRMECEAREDYYRTQRGIQCMIDRQNAKLKAQASEIESQAAEINRLHAWMESHGYDPAKI